jgi:CheY-like chemotaxis protein
LTMVLPKPVRPASAKRTSSTQSTTHAILVVDDSRDIRDSLERLLTDEGHDVVTASNGREALNALGGGTRPCLVLLDLMMPVMDGYTFMEHQKNDPALSAFPLVIISAGAMLDRDRIGNSEILLKPIRMNALMAVVARHC